MRALSSRDCVEILDRGEAQHPLDRALLLLSYALPDRRPDELAALTIGQRDGLLLEARGRLFGQEMRSVTACGACGEELSFTLTVDQLRVEGPSGPEFDVESEGYAIRARLPNSADLAAATRRSAPERARQILLQRCVIAARREGLPVAVGDLPGSVVSRLSREMSERDPQAEILLNLQCPSCSERWKVQFDVLSFFWSELNREVQKLTWEVHTLARAYGWTEPDVLRLSPSRRRRYVEMAAR